MLMLWDKKRDMIMRQKNCHQHVAAGGVLHSHWPVACY